MRRYACPNCRNEIHFGNSQCVSCGFLLGYVPGGDLFLARGEGGGWHDGPGAHEACANRSEIGCNWLVEASGPHSHCLSCRHTLIIPDLSQPENRDHWAALEEAKRRLFYAISKFGLSVGSLEEQPHTALRFEFKTDTLLADGTVDPVLTGHESGLVTINVAEADDPVREERRKAMGEPYRTLIGHFRHEIGHYFWDRLVANSPRLDACRALFGDERQDYAEALRQHYRQGPSAGWEQTHVSAYACAHPWEDFAETWAHYFHIVDGLETARWYGLDRREGLEPDAAMLADGRDSGPYTARDFRPLMDAWVPLTVAMNAMNRSIGLGDFYPFVLSDTIFAKLGFIHGLIHDNGQA